MAAACAGVSAIELMECRALPGEPCRGPCGSSCCGGGENSVGLADMTICTGIASIAGLLIAASACSASIVRSPFAASLDAASASARSSIVNARNRAVSLQRPNAGVPVTRLQLISPTA